MPAARAPYFHEASAATLDDVDLYVGLRISAHTTERAALACLRGL